MSQRWILFVIVGIPFGIIMGMLVGFFLDNALHGVLFGIFEAITFGAIMIWIFPRLNICDEKQSPKSDTYPSD